MAHLLLLALCAALAAGRPNNVRTSVLASQTGRTTGGGSVVNQAQGTATAGSISATNLPGLTRRDARNANAAASLQGASAGNGDFSQTGGVTAGTQGGLGRVGTNSATFNRGRARNAALTNALAGSAGATQRVSQQGVLLAGRRDPWPVGRQRANLNLNTGSSVGSQAGISGTGTFRGTNTVSTTAGHETPLAGAVPTVFQGTGSPRLGNLQPRPPRRPRRMPRMMRGGRGGD